MKKRTCALFAAALSAAILCAAPGAVSAASPDRGQNGWAEMQPPAPPVFRLHFETNGGEAMADAAVSCLRTVSLAAYTPVRDGYSFRGWYLDEALTKPAASLRLTRHTAVYAAWDELPGESEPVSRAAFVAALWQAAGAPVVDYLLTYSDIAADAPYAEAVRWASSERIALGTDGGLFKPDDALTREECAALLYRLAEKQGQGFTGAWMFLLPYEDRAALSEWAYKAFAWCHMKGILTGTDGMCRPKDALTREECAAILAAFRTATEI